MTFVPNRNLINKQLADQSHAHTSWDPEKRSAQEIQGFVDYIQNVYDSMQKYTKTDAQKELLDAEMQRYQSGYATKYNADLAAKGRTFSSMITGVSGFNVRAHEKANKAEQNRYDDMKEWDDRAQTAILRELKKLSIEEAGGELEVMKKKLADAEEAQENYKKINLILRKKNLSDDAKVQEIIAATGYKESTARNMFNKDFAGRTGIPSYVLTNNNANIRRMQERLKEMEKKEATPTTDIDFAGGTIIDNAEVNRIQIFFDKIPPDKIRTKLKGSGWKWSPNAGAWQRMRTEASRNSAKQITGAVATTTNQVQEIKQELKQGETVTIPETVLKQAELVKDNPELTDALKIIKNSFDIWYSSGSTLDSEYSTDMLTGAISKTTYIKENGHADLERFLTDLKKLGYNNLKEWYEPRRGTSSVQEIKQELKSGETIEVPETIIPGLMKKGTLPDPDWEFEKQQDERIKAESEREDISIQEAEEQIDVLGYNPITGYKYADEPSLRDTVEPEIEEQFKYLMIEAMELGALNPEDYKRQLDAFKGSRYPEKIMDVNQERVNAKKTVIKKEISAGETVMIPGSVLKAGIKKEPTFEEVGKAVEREMSGKRLSAKALKEYIEKKQGEGMPRGWVETHYLRVNPPTTTELEKDITKIEKQLEKTYHTVTSRARATTREAQSGKLAQVLEGKKSQLKKIVEEKVVKGATVKVPESALKIHMQDTRTDAQIIEDLSKEEKTSSRRHYSELTQREKTIVDKEAIKQYPVTSAHIGALITISGSQDKRLKEFDNLLRQGETVAIPQPILAKQLEAPAAPMLLYSSRPSSDDRKRLEFGKTLEISGDKLGAMLHPARKASKPKPEPEPEFKSKKLCMPPVRVRGYHVGEHNRSCPIKEKSKRK